MDPHVTVILSRADLIEALDTVADIVHKLEQLTDGVASYDPDEVIRELRGVVADLSFAVEVPDLLG